MLNQRQQAALRALLTNPTRATAAAAAARGAVSANLRFSIDIVEIGGERRMVLIDAGEESEG